ncbi:MAG: glycosyltransferase family 2 protein [Phycisphaerales bacterium]
MAGGPSDQLAVALTAFNSMRTIEPVLKSVQPIAGRIVVVDSGSTDGTIECCRDHGAEVIHQPWLGFAAQKQFAIDQCAEAQWVLLLDSDESLEPDLQATVQATVEADDPAYDGWWINRKLWYLGGWLHHAFQPEWRLRLVRGGKARSVGPGAHDQLLVDGRTGRLDGDCRHDSYENFTDMASRHVRYGDECVRDPDARGGGGVGGLLVSPSAAFLKQYVLKRGFLDGRRGLLASAMAAHAALVKHGAIAASELPGASPDAGE